MFLLHCRNTASNQKIKLKIRKKDKKEQKRNNKVVASDILQTKKNQLAEVNWILNFISDGVNTRR